MRADPALRILVVDPCPDNADSLVLLLNCWGYQACSARDGPQALEVNRTFRPQVVLLEVALPGADGWELGRLLREQASAHLVVLIALTVCGREPDRVRSREAGFDGHLTKPACLDKLHAVLEGVADRLEMLPGWRMYRLERAPAGAGAPG